MSEQGPPQGVNSAMLESMRKSGAEADTRSGGNVGGGMGIDNGLGAGGKMFPIGEAQFDLGVGGEPIKLPGSGEGAFSRNPFTDIADGNLTGIGNINALAGLEHYQGIGNISLSEGATVGSGVNLPSGLSAIKNPSRGG